MEKHTTLLDRIVDFSADGRRVIASVLVLSLILAGCSNFRERFFSSHDQNQSYAEGGRRAPVLNPGATGGTMAMTQHAPAPMPGAPATSAPMTPYDRYNSTPGPMGMQATHTASSTSYNAAATENKGWFGRTFGGWFGGDEKPVATSASTRRRPLENQPQMAGAPEAPQMAMAAPVESMQMESVTTVTKETRKPTPLLEEDGYPDLAAIPPVPPRAEAFRKDRMSTQDKFADLQAESNQAEARRKDLAAEPGLLPDETALPAEEELAAASRRDATDLPSELPNRVTVAPPTRAPVKEKKEEGGLFSWFKNPFSNEEKTAAPAMRKPVSEPRTLAAAPVTPVTTSSKPISLRAPGAMMDVPPPPSISDERPIVLHEPKAEPRYEEVEPGHLRLTPPSGMTLRSGRALPPSRYAARRAQERMARNSGAGASYY